MPQRSEQLSTDSNLHLEPQLALDLFQNAFSDEFAREKVFDEGRDTRHVTPDTSSILDSDAGSLAATVQTVKSFLYHRDYLHAFDSDRKRAAYLLRWSPSRALAYAALFAATSEIAALFAASKPANVLAIGAGAAGELVALASLLAPAAHARRDAAPPALKLHIVDIADWSAQLQTLAAAIRRDWLYGRAADSLDLRFSHADALQMDAPALGLASADLVTLMFTTNELFAEHRAASVRLLAQLGAHCPVGCLLLVVESAGSYSDVAVGGRGRQFPLHFLLDTLLAGGPAGQPAKKPTSGPAGGPEGRERTAHWEVVQHSDSTWYRCPELHYPLQLENMRFFYRLYRKVR